MNVRSPCDDQPSVEEKAGGQRRRPCNALATDDGSDRERKTWIYRARAPRSATGRAGTNKKCFWLCLASRHLVITDQCAVRPACSGDSYGDVGRAALLR